MKMLKLFLFKLLLVAGVSICLNAIASDAKDNEQEKNAGSHAVPGERLRSIMQNINLTIHDSTNPDTQTERINKQDMEDMIEAVEELLFYAEMMSTELPRSELNKSDLVTFRALAGQLYTEALNIQQTAKDYNLETYDYELLNISYRRLNETCAACHQLFRDK